MLPNFICPGAQKAGTTTLYMILKQHPSIFLPSGKEQRFFFEDSKFKKGVNWYRETFYSSYGGEKAIGDITPDYMFFEGVAQRIYDTLGPEIRFIFLLRNPYERAYSHYWMSVRRGFETKDFYQALMLEEARIERSFWHKNHFSYATRGLYARQVMGFLQYFKGDNMLFVDFDRFIEHPEDVCMQIWKFLDIGDNSNIDYKIHHNPTRMPISRTLHSFLTSPPRWLKSSVDYLLPAGFGRQFAKRSARVLREKNYRKFIKPPLTISSKRFLTDFFLADIRQLSEITGCDYDSWIEPFK